MKTKTKEKAILEYIAPDQVKPAGSNKKALYLCQCGEYISARVTDVNRGNTTSCGCAQRSMLRERNTTHGQACHGARSGTYQSYLAARKRCTDTAHDSYAYYGGRGIRFLFDSFEEFYAELGERPGGMSVDRVDVNGHYQAGNIRWATPTQQNQNRRCQ